MTTAVAPSELIELAARANEEHRACEESLKAGLAHALAAGEYLTRAKELLPHGGWLPWLEDNFEGSERTAQAYMRVAREWPQLEEGKAQRVADLPFREAVRLLAAAPSQEPVPPVHDEGLEADMDDLTARSRALDGAPKSPETIPALMQFMDDAVALGIRARCQKEQAEANMALVALEAKHRFGAARLPAFAAACGIQYLRLMRLIGEVESA